MIVIVACSVEFCRQLHDLVQSAPPTSDICEAPPSARSHSLVDTLMTTPLFQSILVTQFHHWQPPEDLMATPTNSGNSPFASNTDDREEDAEYSEPDEESFDPPWPNEHEAFCALPLIQEQIVLEIAAGFNSHGATVSPMEVSKGRMKVILPGSLRERGEFCVVDVAFMKEPSTAAKVSTSKSAPGLSSSLPQKPPPSAGKYRWMVRQTRFHCLNDFV